MLPQAVPCQQRPCGNVTRDESGFCNKHRNGANSRINAAASFNRTNNMSAFRPSSVTSRGGETMIHPIDNEMDVMVSLSPEDFQESSAIYANRMAAGSSYEDCEALMELAQDNVDQCKALILSTRSEQELHRLERAETVWRKVSSAASLRAERLQMEAVAVTA